MILRPDHVDVLLALEIWTRPEGEMCVPFITLMNETEKDRTTVRRCCRYLAKRGLAAFHKGLWTDDGDLAGAGYCITKAGLAKVAELFPADTEACVA